MGLKVHGDGRSIEGLNPQAQVIHVAPSNWSGGGDEIHQGTSGTKLNEPRLE
jgi:hypothetical protein